MLYSATFMNRLVESWTLTKRICLMMKPSSLVVHDDIFILNLVPPIVNYPKRFRFLRNLRSCCPKKWGSFDNDEINRPNHTVVLKIFTVWSLEWERFTLNLVLGVEILWKLIETMFDAVVCCLQGESNHFFHFENFHSENGWFETFFRWNRNFWKFWIRVV